MITEFIIVGLFTILSSLFVPNILYNNRMWYLNNALLFAGGIMILIGAIY
jgi:hypothetical protein